jgi:hypothetical protein
MILQRFAIGIDQNQRSRGRDAGRGAPAGSAQPHQDGDGGYQGPKAAKAEGGHALPALDRILPTRIEGARVDFISLDPGETRDRPYPL